MTQKQLDRAIAQATGESVSTIRHRGFGLIIVPSTKAGSPIKMPRQSSRHALPSR